jgi:signal transduction histidine kinase
VLVVVMSAPLEGRPDAGDTAHATGDRTAVASAKGLVHLRLPEDHDTTFVGRRRSYTRRMTQVRRRVPAVDLALGAALLALGLADALTQTEYAGGRARLVAAVVLQTAPLALRRTHTFLAVALSALGVVVEVAGEQPYGGVYGLLGFVLLVHATARWAGGTEQRYAVGALVAGLLAHSLSERVDGPLGGLAQLLMPVAVGAAAWAVGTWGRSREGREQDLVAQQQAAVVEERARISRELHDIVGHALAGISLTAGAAERSGGDQDQETRSAFRLIRSLSQDAAADVRLLVGMLREDQEEGREGPQPSLDSLPALVDQARSAGLDVTLDVRGDRRAAPAGVQLAAYRVVQEGLTNAGRHAPGAPVTVHVSWSAHRLGVEVSNRAPRTTRPDDSAEGSGLGLVGLRERVHLHGGELEARPTDDGGFTLSAGLPLR